MNASTSSQLETQSQIDRTGSRMAPIISDVHGPLIHQLSIKDTFNSLTEKEKLYAHHMARAAWKGTRIILRQVSPEANSIFNFILALHRACDGNWEDLAARTSVSIDEVDGFLDYAATFLSNVGNYYGSGDQKFTPNIAKDSLARLSSVSLLASRLFEAVKVPLFSPIPSTLGFPGETTQSAYYPREYGVLAPEEISRVSKFMESNSIFPENTRIQKLENKDGKIIYEVLQASVEHDEENRRRSFDLKTGETVRIVRGDHSAELNEICKSLQDALRHAANSIQVKFLKEYMASFTTGDLETYRESQITWVKDLAPSVENIFGFVEPYRDPFGIRAEFEGLVAISHPEETKTLANLAAQSAKFIRRLPWAHGYKENDGKGPFEKALFEAPDFTSIHALAYCSSIIFPGINVPNYNDIRQEVGFKNVIIANRMAAESSKAKLALFVDESEALIFQDHKFAAYYLWVVLHELLGHGTGKMMRQDAVEIYNFDIENPPTNPLTGNPISCWYRPGQTWTGVFGDLATTVDECRAELVGAYLMDDVELLGLFGFTDHTGITCGDITYNMYLQLGVDGIRGLANFNAEDGKWGQAHSRAHFAILKHLLRDGNNFMTIDCDPVNSRLTVRLDRPGILKYGKPALGRMLLRLHIYRCTADIDECRSFYEDLSRVNGEFLEWRRIVLASKEPKWVFSQPNTFVDGEHDGVSLKEYPATSRGVIESWAERDV